MFIRAVFEKSGKFILSAAVLFSLSACSEIQLASHVFKTSTPPAKSQGTFKVGNRYKIGGKYYYPEENYNLVETGIASWYGPQFHGKQTANGEIFDMNELTAAHRTLQMPSLVRVTNLENGRSLIVRVNDRGPYSRGRIIDLSRHAAELLGFKNKGTAKVRLEVLKQESIQIANAAKQGINTNGYEVALNRNKPLPGSASTSSSNSYPATQTASVQQASASPTSITQSTSQNNTQIASAQQPSNIYSSSAQSPQNSAQAINQQPYPYAHQNATVTAQPLEPLSQQQVQQAQDVSQQEQGGTFIPGHTKDGNFYPDAMVTEMPVTPTDIFVQAGSFTNYDNAIRLSKKLSTIGQAQVSPVMVNNTQFYRVRIGPLSTVDAADGILDTLASQGNASAIIVVE